ncbi:N-acetylmuramoyl-L-alanine amidase [Pandoraea capi]|uniref:N-acetylmuramoyl-L-alanine amidase n=1 Tax=Pandoraea capi TaxID=2508286 RepID=UPI00263F5862|nr:N-acetylmuramoyl-L-alanine amidase [Pandoraea sp. LA3]MDN4583029.1 N-acetylmuramoyl-L-alanine amidase [Pandoraea capi]
MSDDEKYRKFLLNALGRPLARQAGLLARPGKVPPMVRECNGYFIDKGLTPARREPRIRTLVLHYTATSLLRSLSALTNPAGDASAHYVVPETADDDNRFVVYQLVPERQLARHAGVSGWRGERLLNGTSIGVEIVNPGYPADDARLPLMDRRWHPFPMPQIAVVGRLVADIVVRYGIAPDRVLGHADVAPGRTHDPGPRFPWRWLHEQFGVGAWPDDARVAHYRDHRPYRGDVPALQAKLLAYGFDTPQTGELDASTTDVIAAFQMHFHPARYDGVPDVETVAVLDALLEKYGETDRAMTAR